MQKKLTSFVVVAFILVSLLTGFFVFTHNQQVKAATNAPNVFASPIQAGCYIAAPNDCRIHVEPFSIDIASGQKLVFFQLVAIQQGTGVQTMIYDFRPDVSNPVPFSGSLVTPSLVAQDFAASCGKIYSIDLQGQDTGDSSPFNLGQTHPITCPSKVP